MLTKMPTETKSKTEPSQLSTKYFAGVAIVIAVLGIMGGYTIFPMLQTPKELTLTSNLTNNNTTNLTSPVVKHSTTVTNKSVDSSSDNTTGSGSKNKSKTNNQKEVSSSQHSVRNSTG